MTLPDEDRRLMAQAVALARRGIGHVEPNPPVGCVLTQEGKTLAVGWHRQFGGPHAEIAALAVAGDLAAGATAYVSLEPCVHHGKTGPCVDALIKARVARVVIGVVDPNPLVSGQGIDRLAAAGIDVEVGVEQPAAEALIAPFAKLQREALPWVVAKWAMTLDGKLASRTGASQWISNPQSRSVVHELRGRMDAIVVGSGTLLADDPRLTARPSGPRVATRVVLDRRGRFPDECQLLRTREEAPVLVVLGPDADPAVAARLERQGVECYLCESNDPQETLREVLAEFGRRQWTNVLCEGGAELLGSLLDGDLVDEVHAFIAPKLIGGRQAPSPIGGLGRAAMGEAVGLVTPEVQLLDGDVYLHGRLDPAMKSPAIKTPAKDEPS